jgi:hypothetical protein
LDFQIEFWAVLGLVTNVLATFSQIWANFWSSILICRSFIDKEEKKDK